MAQKINSNEIYDGRSYYPDFTNEIAPSALVQNVYCLDRLKMELAHKPYFIDQELMIFLEENGLDAGMFYNKDTMYKRLLQTVVAVLQALGNNLDLFMRVEMNFGTKGEAYSNLRKRIEDLKKRIDKIKDEQDEEKSDITFMFKD